MSAFVGWHLFAILLGALPPPERLSNFPPRDKPSALGPGFDAATTWFDRTAAGLLTVPRVVWKVTRPVQRAAARYRDLAGIGQSWAMFSNPPQYDEYVRTRYYVQPPRGRTWMVTELVSPALREDRVRLVESYRASYQDKAIAIMLAAFYAHRKADLIKPDTATSQLPNDLAPIARYFSSRYARTSLEGTGARIVRTEVWAGRAATPALGVRRDDTAFTTRLAALQAYYEGPVDERLNVRPYPPYHGGELEADINWVLEYFEES